MASAALPGLLTDNEESWSQVQDRMRSGEPLAPLLPLGTDAAYLWIPKNGCSTLKNAWLRAHGINTLENPADPIPLSVHSTALVHTWWHTPEQLAQVAEDRRIVAVWRDPIERFASACRSHLIELTSQRVHERLLQAAEGERDTYADYVAYHQELFSAHGVTTYSDDCSPQEVMNQAAISIENWLACHLDWCHHTLPQTAFLGQDPRCIDTLLRMDQIDGLASAWGERNKQPIPPQIINRSSDYHADPYRVLSATDLSSTALQSLHKFYAEDWAFARFWESARLKR